MTAMREIDASRAGRTGIVWKICDENLMRQKHFVIGIFDASFLYNI